MKRKRNSDFSSMGKDTRLRWAVKPDECQLIYIGDLVKINKKKIYQGKT